MKLLRHLKNIIEISPIASKLFDKTASTKLYKILVIHRANLIISKLKANKNFHVVIETTNFCNAKCIMCPHTNMKRIQKTMSQVTFKRIVTQIKKEGIRPSVFLLNGFGEPLIDPNLVDRIKTLKANFPYSKIKFYTNLSLATNKLIKAIVKSELDEINISLNGYNSQSYKQIMSLDYNQTIKNLKILISTKQQYKHNLKIRISMTLVKNNQKLAKNFIKKWQTYVDSVSVNKIHDYAGNVNNDTGNFKINLKKATFPCRYIWDTINFDVDGNIVLCCLDYESKYKFGNINTSSILHSFYSSKFKAIRRKHLAFQSKQIDICRHCYTPYKNGVEWLVTNLF